MPSELPKVGDLVVVTVLNVKNFGADVKLEEYPKVMGFVHIAEVSTGWIKHIRDYIREGQRTVCKVLNVDSNRGIVDLSLKRVNDHQKREKITEWKNDQKSEKLLELVAAQLKKSVDECEKEFAGDLRSRYATMYDAFEDAAISEEWLPEVKAKWKTTFIKIAKENIVPPEVEIGGYLEAYSIASNGIESIKKTLTSVNSQSVNIQYSGAPKYRISVTDKDYKSAEDTLKKSVQKILDTAKKNNVSAKFIRE